MNYSFLIDNMTWSYSRLSSFESCPYKFYLKYIRNYDDEPRFFSSFGSFIHLIIEKFLKGELKKEELATYYLINFRKEVTGDPPSNKVFSSYFQQGLDYVNSLSRADEEILGVEKYCSFKINDKDFVGIIDKVSRTNGIEITDNKSKMLKPRTNKGTAKTDEELDEYLRQLYIYSIPIKNEYGEFPTKLKFNCFRSKDIIIEPFNPIAFEKTKVWCLDLISKIRTETDWSPQVDYFKCKYICDVSSQCEYFNLF